MPLPRIVSTVLQLFDRIPWWAIHLGLILSTVALMGVVLGGIAVQGAIQGIVVGSIYVLGASGLSLTYGVKRFANFAHGDMMTVGAYVAFAATVFWGQHILWAVVGAALSVAFLGMFLELSIFRRLEGRAAVAPLIASVGVALVLQNLLAAIFDPDVKYLRVGVPPDFLILNTGLTFNTVKGGVTLVVATAFIIFLHILLKYTTLGKAMRACADDLDLARTSGINTRNVTLWTWGISGAFAGVGGVLLAIVVNVYPYTGFFVLLYIFAAVIIGGIGSPYGAMIGGLVVGLVQKLSNVLFGALATAGVIQGGSAYEPAGAFIIMILVLLIKPDGIMGTSRQRLGARILPIRFGRRGR